MRPTNYLPEPALLLSMLASVSLLAAPAMAQDRANTPDSKPAPADNRATTADNKATTADNKATPADKTATPGKDASPTPDAQTPQESNTAKPRPATDKPSPAADKPTPSPTEDKKSSPTPKRPKDTTSTGSETPATKANPTITGGSSATTGAELTGFPTLTRGGAIPTYPAPTVPPTNNAPFMHRSTMPEGTVFIAVGVTLGAFGLGILLWRSIVSFLLHRSVKRAAMAQHAENAKAGFPAPPAPFYKYTDQRSTMGVGPGLGAGAGAAVGAGRGVRRTPRGPIPSAVPSHSNLFFSPTAASNAAGGRGSALLPAGFYASGSGAPAANQTNSISLSNLSPDLRGHYVNTSRHTLSGSPPDSPQYGARRDLSATSTSSLHLNSLTPGQRAPSAYLEDLLADDPGALPPPQIPPSTGPRNSTTGSGNNSMPNRI